MINDRRPPAAEHADAYRASEPTRQRDPFAAPTLQVALASETERIPLVKWNAFPWGVFF